MKAKKNEAAPLGGPARNVKPDLSNSSTSDALLESVLSSLSGVKKVKDGHIALCPFHADHNPSLMVFDNGGFYCRACKERGTLYRLAKHLGIETGNDKEEKHSLNAFREYLSKRLGIETLDVEKVASRLDIRANGRGLSFVLAMPPSRFIGFVNHNPGDKEVKYRLPSREYLQQNANLDDLKGTIFGLDLALNVVKVNHLEERIKGIQGNILLTEGFFDALGCLAHGIPAAAIMGGLNGSEEGIRRVYNALFDAGISRVVLCFDNDSAGRKFTVDYMKHFLSRAAIWTDVIVLEEYKDINEGLQKEGIAFFEKLESYKTDPIEAFIELEGIEGEIEKGGFERHIALMKVARFFSEIHKIHRERVNRGALIERLGTSEEEWNALFEELPLEREKERIKNEMTREGRLFLENIESDPVGAFERFKDRGELSIGSLEKRKPISVAEELPEILEEIIHEGDGHKLHDAEYLENIIIQPVDLVTIGGQSSIGKTTFALNVADYYLREKKRVLFVSYEINRGRIVSSLLAIRTKGKVADVRRNLKKSASVDPTLFENLSIIADPAFTVEELSRLVGKYKEELPLDLIIIDYDQLAQTEEKRFDSEERRVSHISRTLKGITLDYGVPVILLSQLSKEKELRYSQQKLFDSSIVLKLKIPQKEVNSKKNGGKKLEDLKGEDLKAYKEDPIKEVVCEVEKNRNGRAGLEYRITIDFEVGRILSKKETEAIIAKSGLKLR